jgi:alpha-L-fucosidase
MIARAPLGSAVLVLLAGVLAEPARAGGPVAPDDPFTSPRTSWFREARYGMFIHWGLYAVPAGEYHGQPVAGTGEWIMYMAKIPIPEYEQYARQFNPTRFNARAWARLARLAGMRYLVITAKHHEGFSMFGTRVNTYNIVQATPYKRDPMLALAAACRAEGIQFCFYYSILDWHHPDANAAGVDRYVSQMKAQLRELVVNYDPAILWFDGWWVDWWTEARGKDLERYLRGLKPGLILNNRIGKATSADGDYDTPEQAIPTSAQGRRLWETCMTLNDTWGYRKDDHHWKSPADVVHNLADIASKGGNYLLNVGPTAEGVIPPAAARVLPLAGSWLRRNGAAIYGTTASPLPQPAWGRITQRGTRLYLIVFNWPRPGTPLRLEVPVPVRGASLLANGAGVRVRARGAGGVDLFLPALPPSKYASVVAVDLGANLGGMVRRRGASWHPHLPSPFLRRPRGR